MTRRFFLYLSSGVAAAQIAKPRIGYFIDRDGGLRSVGGVAGAFTVGPVLERDLLSAAYSGSSLVLKRSNEVQIDGTAFESPAGPASVGFDKTGRAVEIFFTSANLLWTAHDGAWTPTRAYGIVSDAYIRDGELVVAEVPVRLARPARHVSQLGNGWLVVYSDDRIYAVRGLDVFELPEGEGD